MHDIHRYHESLTDELDAVKNRIRNLTTHWATDGEWKEAALRTTIRRHLPGTTPVGRGFIVARDNGSTQIDILVLKEGKPAIFRDGELAIVTPDVPSAIAEVKTNLQGTANWCEAIKKLADNGKLCEEVAKSKPWLGLFTYEGNDSQVANILDAVSQVHAETKIAINCITCGYDLFVRYWPIGESEPGDTDADVNQKYWRAYQLTRLAPSYFVGNLVDAVCNVDRHETDYVWFAYADGKRSNLIAEKRVAVAAQT